MLGRQSVKVTYAHKKRHLRNANKLLSSPLEVLPPDMDNLTRSEMARRMLKRSRRVALAEQAEDEDVDPMLQTPFQPQQSMPAVPRSLELERMSPVPVTTRVASRTSSRSLKENSTPHLASPFNSRPGSPSPEHKGRGRSSHRVSRIPSLRAQPRTLSSALKENTRRELSFRSTKHRRCPSGPSTAYMRTQSQENWIVPPKVFSRTFDDSDDIPSPGGSFPDQASFRADQPQSCSTPVRFRLRTSRNAKPDGLSLRKAVRSLFATHDDSDRNVCHSGVRKSPVGETLLILPGTSPCHGENLVQIHGCRNPQRPTRNRAATIRASEFTKPSTSSEAPRSVVSVLCHVPRTRSGTVVGPDSMLAAPQTAKSTTKPKAVQSRLESESDDELLLKGPWTEDIEYLGLAVPQDREDAEADELNLGGLWHGMEFPPSP